MADIFISYRRDDSSGYAGRLYDQVSAHFGSEHVFMDVATIAAGSDFVQVIDEKVGTCDALIAIIGKNWLTSRDEQNRLRLTNPDDFVSIEIAAALKRNIEVIPVLVGGAKMPLQRDLPEQLQFLSRRQALEISDARFTRDVADLIEALERPGGSRASRLSNRAWVAIGCFVCVLAVGIGVWIWQNSRRQSILTNTQTATRNSPPQAIASPPETPSNVARSSDISGNWKAVVKKEDVTFEIFFTFEVVGDKLFGKAIYPTGEAGILNGTIHHGEISFQTKHVPQFSDEEATTTVEGTVKGGEIQIIVQTSDGYAKGVAHRVSRTEAPKVLTP
jgi:hypothetical protein